jgi:1-acyl-sn-glycerol-3-phosphate acyltransferase
MKAKAPLSIDLDAVHALEPYAGWLSRHYFRHEVRGLGGVVAQPTLLIGNHSGGKLPIDAFLFGIRWHQHFHFDRPLHPLIHDFLFHTPLLGPELVRLGCMRASQENAQTALEAGRSVMVLPGGDYETFRPYSERHKIDFAGRMGFIRTALRLRVPLTPVVHAGSHELFFVLARGERLAKFLKLPTRMRAHVWPIILGFPGGLYFGPVPAPLPLPSRITTEVLPAMWLEQAEADHRAYTPGDASDPAAVLEIYGVVLARMQGVLDRLASERKYPIVG